GPRANAVARDHKWLIIPALLTALDTRERVRSASRRQAPRTRAPPRRVRWTAWLRRRAGEGRCRRDGIIDVFAFGRRPVVTGFGVVITQSHLPRRLES